MKFFKLTALDSNGGSDDDSADDSDNGYDDFMADVLPSMLSSAAYNEDHKLVAFLTKHGLKLTPSDLDSLIKLLPLKEEVAQLHRKIAQLESDQRIAQLKLDTEQHQEAVAGYKEEIQELQSKLAMLEKENDKHADAINKSAAAIKERDGVIKKRTEQIKDLASPDFIVKQIDQAEQLQTQITQLKDHLQKEADKPFYKRPEVVVPTLCFFPALAAGVWYAHKYHKDQITIAKHQALIESIKQLYDKGEFAQINEKLSALSPEEYQVVMQAAFKGSPVK